MRVPLRRHGALTVAFLRAARVYWLGLYPRLRHELRHWHRRAQAIPDPMLRRTALDAQAAKVGNIEGAVAFATFAASPRRAAAARAMAAYEATLDYLDCLCEMPNHDPIANGRCLNHALMAAVDPNTAHCDYYARHPDHADGGYLCGLLDACRSSLQQLPTYSMVAGATRRISARNATYQSLNHGDMHGSHQQFDRWVQAEAAKHKRAHPDDGLRWWEIGAAAGSSLGVFALIAAATYSTTSPADATNIEYVYFPWIGAVNSLLDSLIDQREDAAPGQHRLLDYYHSHDEAVSRVQSIITQARDCTVLLRAGHQHAMILAAMVSFYLSAPEIRLYDANQVSENILKPTGELGSYTTLIMRARRVAGRIAERRGSSVSESESKATSLQVSRSDARRQAGSVRRL